MSYRSENLRLNERTCTPASQESLFSRLQLYGNCASPRVPRSKKKLLRLGRILMIQNFKSQAKAAIEDIIHQIPTRELFRLIGRSIGICYSYADPVKWLCKHCPYVANQLIVTLINIHKKKFLYVYLHNQSLLVSILNSCCHLISLFINFGLQRCLSFFTDQHRESLKALVISTDGSYDVPLRI